MVSPIFKERIADSTQIDIIAEMECIVKTLDRNNYLNHLKDFQVIELTEKLLYMTHILQNKLLKEN